MGYFASNKGVTFKKIEENVEYRKALEEKNILLSDLLKVLLNKDYIALNNILDETVRNNFEIMAPIIYSVKEQHKTFEVYRHCGKSVQENEDLAMQIIREEPDVFIGTTISGNSEFILKIAINEPKVITVMSDSLKSNTSFTAELCNLNDKEVTKFVAQECKMPDTVLENPDLSENKDFMAEVVKKDANSLEYASDDLKDNYDFIKETCSENKEVIDYISEHTEEFGDEGLTAAKEVLVENTTDRAINEFEEELKKVQEQKKSKNEEQEVEENKASKELAIRERQLKNNMRLIEKIKNGEVKQERAIRLINSICKNLGEEYRKELMQYIKMDDAIVERQKESKEKEKIETPTKRKKPENIENITENASFKGVKEETSVTIEELQNEKKQREEEKIYGNSDDERT